MFQDGPSNRRVSHMCLDLEVDKKQNPTDHRFKSPAPTDQVPGASDSRGCGRTWFWLWRQQVGSTCPAAQRVCLRTMTINWPTTRFGALESVAKMATGMGKTTTGTPSVSRRPTEGHPRNALRPPCLATIKNLSHCLEKLADRSFTTDQIHTLLPENWKPPIA